MTDQAEKSKRGRPRKTPAAPAGGTVLALERGLVVLEALSKLHSATLGDLATWVKMPVSTVYRVLGTLQKHGFVDFEPDRQQWAVGVGAFRIGSAYLLRTNLIEASIKVMRSLMQHTGETANLGIAEGGSIVFVSQVETPNPIRAMFRQGTGSPMHASGIGKAMLASLPRSEVENQLATYGQPAFTPHTLTDADALWADLGTITARGWALDNEERYIGMKCVAAAVFDAHGKAIAGLSVSGPSSRFTEEMIKHTGPVLVEAANTLMEMIGGVRPESRAILAQVKRGPEQP